MALPHNADGRLMLLLEDWFSLFYTQRHVPGNAADDVEMSMERHSLPSERVLT